MGSRGDNTRKKLVDTARRLFRRHGYASTSIEDICRDSGVKRGNLYFYFRSKEELARAALEDAKVKHISFFEILASDEPDPLRRVEAIIDGIVSYHADRHCKPG